MQSPGDVLEDGCCIVEREGGGLPSGETVLRIEVQRLCTFVESPHSGSQERHSVTYVMPAFASWAERLRWNAAARVEVVCMNSLLCLNPA